MHRIFKATAAAAAIFIASPLSAQDETSSSQTSGQESPTDSARLEAAAGTIDHLFPLGTYERMMRGTMDKVMDSMLSSIGAMTLDDLTGANAVKQDAVPEEGAPQTLADYSRAADPHFDERMRISSRVMMDEMVTLMTSMEPEIREALTKIYARKFTVDQLNEMNSFFATDTGAAFARDYMMVFVDPEMMESMMGLVPEMMRAMPDIMQKVEAATAHLPPPPSAEEHEDDSDGSAADEF